MSDLATIQDQKKSLEEQLKQLDLQEIQELTTTKSTLLKELSDIDNKISSLSPTPKRGRGKGFGDVDVNSWIVENISNTGSRPKDLLKVLISQLKYDGKKNSIVTTISASLSRLVKEGKLEKKETGVYVPVK